MLASPRSTHVLLRDSAGFRVGGDAEFCEFSSLSYCDRKVRILIFMYRSNKDSMLTGGGKKSCRRRFPIVLANGQTLILWALRVGM